MTGYWDRYASKRISRRRALVGAGAASVAAAALLAGCGSNSSPGDQEPEGLLSAAKDTTSRAKAGGTYKGFIGTEPASLDPISASTVFAFTTLAHYTYPRLIKFKAVEAPGIPGSDYEGDLAESFELSGDKTRLTLRLRPGLRWDRRIQQTDARSSPRM